MRAPDPKVRAILVYGPNTGLVRERTRRIISGVVGDEGDPFRVAELGAAILKDDPARLGDEAAAMAFGGGRRVVWVRQASDGLAPTCRDVLRRPLGDSLIVLEAGDLPRRSSLRQVFEGAKNAAALPCYADDAGSLAEIVAADLDARGLEIEPEARAVLLERLGADRMLARNELEKLAIYMGPESAETGPGTAPRRVTIDDVLASVGDNAALTLNDVSLAAAGGDAKALDRALDRAFQEGAAPVTVLRAVARHLQRLHRAAALIAAGQSETEAFAALRPPVFFKDAPAFGVQVKTWSNATLGRAWEILTDAELACKTTGIPARAVCGRALIRIAVAARSARAD